MIFSLQRDHNQGGVSPGRVTRSRRAIDLQPLLLSYVIKKLFFTNSALRKPFECYRWFDVARTADLNAYTRLSTSMSMQLSGGHYKQKTFVTIQLN